MDIMKDLKKIEQNVALLINAKNTKSVIYNHHENISKYGYC